MLSRLTPILALTALLGACAHPIVISPLETPVRVEASLSDKKVAYVMTDADRNKQVTTEGGGGDKVNYFPYRDLEKAIRDALRAVYSDVFVIKSPSDSSAIQGNDISFVFAPEISTSSNSQSMFTWPPTQFTIDLSCSVTDPVGDMTSRIRVVGNGAAEFSEFKADFGLAGRRAASELSEKLKQEIGANPRLR
jgi:hypothetical protein